MDEFLRKPNRSKLDLIFKELDKATGTKLAKRYQEWLGIMDAAHVSYRREIPAGISDCVNFLVKREDIEEWLDAEDLYSPAPPNRYIIHNEDLADYDCGIAYFFQHKNEVKSRIKRLENILNTDPGDRYAGSKNPYDDVHIEFSPERQTARMVVDAKLPVTLEKLRHKRIVYNRIITYVTVQSLGLDAMKVLDEFLFDTQCGKDISQIKKIVEGKLKWLEHEQCSRRGIEWKESP